MKNIAFSTFESPTLTLKNRFVLSPMCQYSAENGFANAWHLTHLGSRAVGGFALLIQEATAISPEGRITYKDLGIWSDAHTEALKPITQLIKQQGAMPGIQLAHAGRKASCDLPWNSGTQIQSGEHAWKTVAPSAIAFNPDDITPIALNAEGIQKIKTDFTSAALRAVQAGYEMIEIHAAHGYLLHQFLSPLSNLRTDEYGGSFENRIRLLTQIITEVKSVLPKNFPLWVRISATDWKENGWNVEQSIALSKILKTQGVDLIDVSSGGLIPDAKIPAAPNYQVPFAEAIRKEAQIPTATVGLILNGHQAEEILQNEKADLILIGRAALRDPHFVLRAAHELQISTAWPPQYERAKFH